MREKLLWAALVAIGVALGVVLADSRPQSQSSQSVVPGRYQLFLVPKDATDSSATASFYRIDTATGKTWFQSIGTDDKGRYTHNWAAFEETKDQNDQADLSSARK